MVVMMRWNRKGELAISRFLWFVFLLIIAVVILYIIWKWDTVANFIGDRLFP